MQQQGGGGDAQWRTFQEVLQGAWVPCGAGTPGAVVDAVSKGLAEAVAVPALKGQLAGYGYEVVGSTPGEFGAHIERELGAWRRAVEVSGAKVN